MKIKINDGEVEGFFADLHVHSRFSRACSKDLNLENIEQWARIKGVDLMGTGDFSHPVWLQELKENLEDRGGLFYTKTGFRFLLTWEVSLMYTQGKGRRVHLVVLAPSFETVDKINFWLDTKGRRDYDGRPIFKISCEDFVAKMKSIDERIECIPAHVWTPWFGVYGSDTGFDSLKEAFGSQLENIHAIETGISSTPEMNLKLKELQNICIVSFSDLHSYWPWRLGREATIFRSVNSYDEILREIRENDILGTVEVNPAYGKYHFDGHRNCDFSCSPEETKRLKEICPKCGKRLTVGVDYRVSVLGEIENPRSGKIVFEILPLHELISSALNCGIATKRVWDIYNPLIKKFENEFNILLNVSEDELLKVADKKIVNLIMLNRRGEIEVKPGYDGVYGVMILPKESKKEIEQKELF
ncbi:MAG: hypothetical protein BV456_10720 [Thermoplasmata archaeon M8B2D]|nr:MAG: hypothetical protein BV456_10720 [Thermoplasmata archaeon M8B2D]